MYDNCKERTPWFLSDVIELMCDYFVGKSCCLTFDSKKLKQGLKHNSGDVDLIGFEQKSILIQRKDTLQTE
jgi:hypothetical protein